MSSPVRPGELASGAPLGVLGSTGGTNEVIMRLDDVDVLLISS